MGHPIRTLRRIDTGRWFGLAAVICGLGWTAPAHADEPPPAPLKPAYFRAALEASSVIAGGTIWYVIDDKNVLDWDYPSAAERFTGKAWRFDNNTFGINQLWHPGEGAIMYVFARANRIGPYGALGYSAAGSTLWEIVIEFNEKVSINDMWTTPLAALPIGEFVHKAALHFAHPGRSPGARALAWTLGLPVYGHRRWDGVDGEEVAPGEEVPPSFSEATVRYGFGLASQHDASSGQGVHTLGGAARFVSIPGYRTPEAFSRWFHEAESVSLSLNTDFGPRAFGMDGFAEVFLLGHHAQDRTLASTIALAPSYSYRRSLAFGFDDREGIVGFPALAWEGRATFRGCTASLAARTGLGFGAMSNPAFPAYRAAYPDAHTKTVLAREGYAFGWDVKTRGDASLDCGSLELRGNAAYTRFRSIEGFDRNQEELGDDSPVVERALRYGLSAWVRDPTIPLSFGIGFDANLRHSEVASPIKSFERTFGGYRTTVGVELRL